MLVKRGYLQCSVHSRSFLHISRRDLRLSFPPFIFVLLLPGIAASHRRSSTTTLCALSPCAVEESALLLCFFCQQRSSLASLVASLVFASTLIEKSFSMAAKLKCSICPKQPTFSDESHLLTHVSSKGHLAHLHKLQVRSHQEVSAGHQLAAYDQWYQQHGLGRLLSDRMLQKEAKRAGKRNRSRPTKKQARSEITENSKIDPSLSSLPMTSIRHSSTFNSQLHRLQTIITPLRARNTPIPSDGETEYDSSPINGFR